MSQVALFDVDGTLVDGHVWRGLLAYPAVRKRDTRWLYAHTLPVLAGLRLRIVSETRFRDHWVRGLAGLLRGWPAAEFEALAAWIASDFLDGLYRPDVVALLEAHRARGERIVLVSTMFQTVLAAIAARLGADAWVGSRMGVVDGRVTGRLDGPSCVGPRKLDFARAYLAEHHAAVSLAECAAYADSISDAALLEAVGQAVAVYPDDDLRVLAMTKGWMIHPA